MTVSRADRIIYGCLVSAALLCATLTGPVLAQQAAPAAQPAQEAPATQNPGTGAPIRLGPRRTIGVPTKPADSPEAAQPKRPGAVEIEQLETVDSDSIGLIGDPEGGLGINMWAGTNRKLAVRLIALMPRAVSSPAMRDLIRRLLLTQAEAPVKDEPGPGLFGLRAQALFAMGELDAAQKLIAAAPPGPPDEQLLRIRVESLFYRQETENACALVQGNAQELKDGYWLQAQAYCLVVAGKAEEAALLSDLLAERKQDADSAFLAAMDAVSGATPADIEPPREFSAMLLSLFNAAGIGVDQPAPETLSAAAHAAVARNTKTPPPLRLNSAERAVSLGTLAPAEMAEIYRLEKLTPEILAEAVGDSALEWGPRGRMLLIQAAMAQSVPAAKAEALRRAIDMARLQEDFGLTAQAMAYPLRGIRPAPELVWFSGNAARALIASGNMEQAMGWLRLSQRQVQDDRAVELWHLAVLAGVLPPETVTEEALTSWYGKLAATQPDLAARRARVFYSLLHTLDFKVSGKLWAEAVDRAAAQPGSVPPAGLGALLEDASTAGRVGEATLLSMLVIGEAGLSAGNLPAINQAVRALRRIGQENTARRIVLETAVAAGL